MKVCILTGAPGEDPDDCTTHDHEAPDMKVSEREQRILGYWRGCPCSFCADGIEPPPPPPTTYGPARFIPVDGWYDDIL